MRVLILAAGYGTRLYPLTLNMPKTLISIKGKVLLSHIMERIEDLKKNFKITDVIVVSNNKFYKVFLDWKKKYKDNVKIVNDGSNSPTDRLGAIGDIQFILRKTEIDDWLILGSDNFFDWSLVNFVIFSLKKRPFASVGVYDLKDKSKAKHFGVVKMDRLKRIKAFREKPSKPASPHIAVCVYFFPKESLVYLNRFLKENKTHDAAGKYIEWLVKESTVYGYVFEGRWVDVGHKDSLKTLKKLVN